MCVCVCVCLSVRTITWKLLQIPAFSWTVRQIRQKSGTSSHVKIIGQGQGQGNFGGFKVTR